jgi:hypothetical protein
MPDPNPNHVAATERLAAEILGRAGVTLVEPVSDAHGEWIQVMSTDPKVALQVVPTRWEGRLVRLERSPPIVIQARARTEPTPRAQVIERRAPAPMFDIPPLPAAIAEQGIVDEALWLTIETGRDPLMGMDFAQAVRSDPLRVEGLIHQRIHDAFHRIPGLGREAWSGGGMAAMQRDTYLLRNRALRNLHGAHIPATAIADSLERNWEDYSGLLQMTALQAGTGNPMAADWLGRIGAARNDLTRAFREASAIAMRAQESADSEDERNGWMRVSCVVRNMWQMVEGVLDTPVARPRAGQLAGPGGMVRRR